MVAIQFTSLFAVSAAFLSSYVNAYGMVAQVVDAKNFCVFLPPTDSADRLIADTEWNAQAFCLGNAPKAKNAGTLPSGFIRSAHFVATDEYVQVTGQIDPTKANLDPADDGGQYDVKAPKGSTCAGWKYYVNLIEPSGNTYCIRCCNDTKNCNRGISEKGCAHIIPGDYSGPYGGGDSSAATTTKKVTTTKKATTTKIVTTSTTKKSATKTKGESTATATTTNEVTNDSKQGGKQTIKASSSDKQLDSKDDSSKGASQGNQSADGSDNNDDTSKGATQQDQSADGSDKKDDGTRGAEQGSRGDDTGVNGNAGSNDENVGDEGQAGNVGDAGSAGHATQLTTTTATQTTTASDEDVTSSPPASDTTTEEFHAPPSSITTPTNTPQPNNMFAQSVNAAGMFQPSIAMAFVTVLISMMIQ